MSAEHRRPGRRRQPIGNETGTVHPVLNARFGTEHSELVFTASDALSLMERVGGLLDELLGDASFLPKYALARAARESVKVALSGDGGDEIFCGYPTFLADAPVRYFQAALRPPARSLVTRLVDRFPSSPKDGCPIPPKCEHNRAPFRDPALVTMRRRSRDHEDQLSLHR